MYFFFMKLDNNNVIMFDFRSQIKLKSIFTKHIWNMFCLCFSDHTLWLYLAYLLFLDFHWWYFDLMGL